MSRSPCRRIVAASLVLMLCVLAAPAKSHAATATWDSFSNPTSKLLSSVVEWFRGLWPDPAMSPRLSNDGKFGAGHSSDGAPARTRVLMPSH
jgi:hypothetical protein